jgi:hypothetical protein
MDKMTINDKISLYYYIIMIFKDYDSKNLSYHFKVERISIIDCEVLPLPNRDLSYA